MDWANRVGALQSENQITPAQARLLTSTALSGAIQNLQDENPELAGQLLESYATYISPQQYSSFDNSISKSRDINASLLAAESVFKQNPNASVPQLRAALGELDLTPKVRKDAMVQLRQMASDRETASTRARDSAGRLLIQNTYERDWQTMDPTQKATEIANIARNKDASPTAVATALRIATATTPVVTDQNVFGLLWRNPGLVGTPGHTWNELADRIKPENWQSLLKRSEALREGTLNTDLVNGELKILFDRYGINTTKKPARMCSRSTHG